MLSIPSNLIFSRNSFRSVDYSELFSNANVAVTFSQKTNAFKIK